MNTMKTVLELFDYLKTSPWKYPEEFYEFLQGIDPSPRGYVVERIMEFLSFYKCLPELQDYILQSGNFNLGTLCNATIDSLLYDNNGKPASIRQGGDAADLVYRHPDGHWIAISAKSLSHEAVGKLDLEKMFFHAPQNTLFGFLVPSKDHSETMINRANKTSEKVTNILKKSLFLDFDDLWCGYMRFSKGMEKYCAKNKKTMDLRVNQRYGVELIYNFKVQRTPNCLLCHEPRSGKTYIIAASIVRDFETNGEGIYLVTTLAPKETIPSFLHLFRSYAEFDDFRIIDLRYDELPTVLPNKSILLGSKQLLQSKLEENSISALANAKISMLFMDETHHGGTTDLAHKVLDTYAKDSFKVYITSTFSKPAFAYDIPKERHIMWSQHSNLAAREGNKELLLEIHHDDPVLAEILKCTPTRILKEQYADVPELITFTRSVNENVEQEVVRGLKSVNNNVAGYSTEAAFLSHENGSLQNETAASNVLIEFFGKNVGRVRDQSSYLYRVTNHAQKNGSRTMETMASTDPLVILMFLPVANVSKLSRALFALMEKHSLCSEFEWVAINSKETSDPLAAIEAAKQRVLNNDAKKAVLVFSGLQCSLAATIPTCDIVVLANNTMKYDLIFQMMTRSMSRSKGKRYGYVIDLNINRQIHLTVNMAAQYLPKTKTLKQKFTKLVEERLVTINPDEFHLTEGTHGEKVEKLSSNLYALYESSRSSMIPALYARLLNSQVQLSKDQLEQLKAFKKIKMSKSSKIALKETVNSTELNNGQEVIYVKEGEEAQEEEKVQEVEEVEKVSFQQILHYLTPVIIVLSLSNDLEDLFDMYLDIKKDAVRHSILMHLVRELWSDSLCENDLDSFFDIYKSMNDQQIADLVRSIKQLLLQSKNNAELLLSELDRYLIPHRNEQKGNAEFPTLSKMRKFMLDLFPVSFWSNPNSKILEPACGKGHFLLELVMRFMNGLAEHFPDEKQRYKHIVENMIYFCDINSFNIYICKLLLDPDNEYALNSYTGDSLKPIPWDLQIFQGCVMNPPYSTSQEVNARNSTPLHHLFVEKYAYAIPYSVFIIPQRWFITGKGLDDFRKEFKNRTDIKSINWFENSKEVFGNHVDIKGGVVVITRDKSHDGLCNFDDTIMDLKVSDVVLTPKAYQTYLSGQSHCNKQGCIDAFFKGRYYGIETNDDRLKDNSGASSKLCYVSLKQSKDRKKYIEMDAALEKKEQFWKVFTPAAFEKANSGFGPLYIANPDELHSASYVSFKVKNYAEALSLKSYLTTNYANELLSIRKASQLISKDTLKWIPNVPLDRIWDDEILEEYLNPRTNSVEAADVVV